MTCGPLTDELRPYIGKGVEILIDIARRGDYDGPWKRKRWEHPGSDVAVSDNVDGRWMHLLGKRAEDVGYSVGEEYLLQGSIEYREEVGTGTKWQAKLLIA